MYHHPCPAILRSSCRRLISLSIILPAFFSLSIVAAFGQEPPPSENYITHMSRGMAALAEQKFASAREHFQSAQSLAGNTHAAAEGLAQARLGLLLQTIATGTEAAREAEKKEAWQEAARHYSGILKLNGSLDFALQGETRAKRLATLYRELDFHLERAQRLSSKAVAQEVSLLLSQVGELSPQGPVLQEKSRRLVSLLDSYGKPQWVILRSDLKTKVRVQKVGGLGLFRQRRLELFPGTYTAVGTRSGFRDVRRQFTIEPGKAPEAALVVICKEKI